MFPGMSQAPQQLLRRTRGLGNVCWLRFKTDPTGVWATLAADHLPGDLFLALGQRPVASHRAWVRREAGTFMSRLVHIDHLTLVDTTQPFLIGFARCE